jgi:hypothetical protein
LLLTYAIDKYLVSALKRVLPFICVNQHAFGSSPALAQFSLFLQVLRVYERPTSYNDRVATLASSVILPVCLLAHCFAGMCVACACVPSLCFAPRVHE